MSIKSYDPDTLIFDLGFFRNNYASDCMPSEECRRIKRIRTLDKTPHPLAINQEMLDLYAFTVLEKVSILGFLRLCQFGVSRRH